MTDRVSRLRRLHHLRSRLADAAAADRARIAQLIDTAEQEMLKLTRMQGSALRRGAAEGSFSWSEQVAELQVTLRHHERWQQQCEAWNKAHDVALLQERTAVLEREQAGRILQRREIEVEAEKSRREQARLDDLFATAQVRSGMTMRF